MRKVWLVSAVAATLLVGLTMTVALAGGKGGSAAASGQVTLTPAQQQKLAADIKAVEDAAIALKDKACIEIGDKDGKAYVAQMLVKLAEVINPTPTPTATAPLPPAPPAPPPPKGKGGKPKGGGG